MKRPFQLARVHDGIKRRVRDRQVRRFIDEIHPQTFRQHSATAEWALSTSDDSEALSLPVDPALDRLKERFFNARHSEGDWRFLVHVPPPEVSLAASSIFRNLIDALDFLGIVAKELSWTSNVSEVLDSFRPSILLTGGHPAFLNRIDWTAVSAYRARNSLAVGLSSPSHDDSVSDSLLMAERVSADLFFDFAAPEFLAHRPKRLVAAFPIVSFEHAASPFLYRPLPDIERDLPFVFMGSVHGDKLSRYLDFFGPLLSEYPGFLLGPGWGTGPPTYLPRRAHSPLYARARVGLNLHIDAQMDRPMQLNERLFNLAAAGVPQVVDSPSLLTSRFPRGCFFVGDNPQAYVEAFESVLADPDEAQDRASLARKKVLAEYTTLHAADALIGQLDSCLH